MAFNSIEFLIFFPLVVMLYFALPHKHRWILLLIASYTFYMFWNAWYISLIVISSITDYVCGYKIGESENERIRKTFLYISLLINLGLLGAFKYFNFFNEIASDLSALLNIPYAVPMLEVILPVGISFYTFQTLSYTLDVYWKRMAPEKHIGYFSLYVSFFPQLVAGPIERGVNLIPQFRKKFDFNYQRVVSGLQLMAWGLFKKVVIADLAGDMVNYFYGHQDIYYGFSCVLIGYVFAMQIYCDFSGYSDIAIGAAEVMGFKLMTNFRAPYLARSIPELWQRWHISLTSWFKDYLFTPLSKGERRINYLLFYLFLIFFFSGIWHGANWTFIIWGSINGFIIVLYKKTNKLRKKVAKKLFYKNNEWWIKWIETFITFFIFTITCFYFRSANLIESHKLYYQLATGWEENFSAIISNVGGERNELLYFGQGLIAMVLLFVFSIFLFFVELVKEKDVSIRNVIATYPITIRWALYIGVVFFIIIFSFNRTQPFIYFQF